MGATAWDPPNLPLFEGAPGPQAGAAPAYGGGLPAPFSGNSGIPYPLPPEWPNYIPGPNAPQQTLDPEVLGQIVNRFLSRPMSVRNLSGAESALPDVSATADSLQPRGADFRDRGPASYEPTSQYQLAQAQRPAGAGMGEVTGDKKLELQQ